MPPQSRQQGALSTSVTSTITTTTSQPSVDPATLIRASPSRTLRLRAEAGPSDASASQTRRHIQWAEDVVNNEGMGKKSSKICCIYHKPRAVDESSSESSDSGSSDSGGNDSGDDGSARPTGGARAQKRPRRHGHQHHHHDHDSSNPSDKGKAPQREPNAYERVPKNT